MAKSPIYLECESFFSPQEQKAMREEFEAAGMSRLTQRMLLEPSCTWRARRPFRAAQFRSRQDPTQFAIVHPSTKQAGRCQVSLFDAQGAYGDRIRDTCEEALETLSHREYKLETVE